MDVAGERVMGDLRWQLLPGLSAGSFDPGELFDGNSLRLEQWLATGQARVIKQGVHRAVYRVVLPGLDFIVKCFPPAAGGSLWRRSPARRECDLARRVAERQVPAVEPLAVGESVGGPGYFLLRTVPDAQPLSTFLEEVFPAIEPARRVRLRQRLAVGLAHFLARMHDAGLTHGDLHPGNILICLESGDRPSFCLVDLHAVCLGPPLRWRASRENLAMLNRWFMLRAARADRLRFWLAYRRSRRTVGWDAGVGAGRVPATLVTRRAVRQLERRSLASNLRFWRWHDRRCLETTRYYRRVHAGAIAGHVVADLEPAVVVPFLADPDAPFKKGSGVYSAEMTPHPCVKVLKNSAFSTVVEFDLPTAAGPRRVIYKRFAVTSWTDPWAALVRRTPALRSFMLGHGLRFRGLPTPRPLGVWHRYRQGLPHEGYLLTEKVPGALDLAAFVTRLEGLAPADRRTSLRRAIDQVARIVGNLHHRRLSHRDLKAANLLMSSAPWSLARSERDRRGGGLPDPDIGLDTASALGAAQAWFIDLVGVRHHGKLRRYRRLQNLARLNASFVQHPGLTRTDRLRFLRVYLRWGLRGRFGWKRWWRQIEEATRAKVQRNRRYGRPLG
jgi:hypothetical protein